MDGYPPEKQAMSVANRLVAEAFVLAMRADFAEAPYDAPYAARPAGSEWLIVSRWGPSAEYLSVSRTGVAAAGEGPAPDGLHPSLTMLGLRVPGPANEPSFLLLRHQPADVPVAGSFVPSDGFARLAGPTAMLRLTAAGRCAHLRGEAQGQPCFADVPQPPCGASGALAWSLSATRRPWLGDYVERGLRPPNIRRQGTAQPGNTQPGNTLPG